MKPAAEDVLRKLEAGLHSVMRERVAVLIESHDLQLPTLSSDSLPSADSPCWFSIPGMYGGRKYWLDNCHEPVRLRCESWSRIIEGSEQSHEIAVHETRRL
jgi:hypothetical protein